MANILSRIIKISIYLLVFLLPLFFLPFSFEAYEFNKQYLLFFLVSIAFFSWIAKMVLIDKEIRFKKTPLDILVVAFIFIAVLSAIFSVDKISSIFGSYGRFSDGLIGLLSLGIFYFLITNNVGIPLKPADLNAEKTPKSATNQPSNQRQISVSGLIKTLLGSVFFVILFSYFSIFGVWARINNLLGGKLALPPIMLQTIFNPASGSLEGLAVFLAVVLVFLIGRIIISDESGKKKGDFINYLLLLAILILLAIIDFNPTWLMIVTSLTLFLVIVLGKRIFKEDVNKLLLPILFVFLAAAFLFVDVSKFQNLILKYQLPQEQVLKQGDSWQIAIKSTVENIKSGFLGSGVGTFHYGFSKFKPAEFNQSILWPIRFDRAGSYVAEILGTMGFLGILSYLVLIGIFLLISYLFLQQNRSGIPLLMAFLALLAGQFVFYQNTILAFTFWLVLGLSVVSWQRPVQEKTISFKDFPELSLVFSTVFIVLGLVFLGIYFFAVKFYLADINYREALSGGGTNKLEKAVNLNPYQTQYKLVIARDYLSKIITEGQKPADQIDLTTLSTNANRAITYAKGGQIDRNTIKGAVELSPNRVDSWETLGMIYRNIHGIAVGALEWGIKSFEKAISLEPTNPVLHTELGKLYLVSNDKDRAKTEFNKAKELKSDYIDASIQIALIYEDEDNIGEAIRQMEDLAASYPFNVEVLFQLGRLYFKNNQADEAITQFEAVIALMPNHSNALYSLGVAYQKKGETQKAIAEFEKVLELNPGNKDVIQKIEELNK